MAKRLFVSRYKSSHYTRWHKFKDLAKRGVLIFIKSVPDGFIYEVSPFYEVRVSRKGKVLVRKKEDSNVSINNQPSFSYE